VAAQQLIMVAAATATLAVPTAFGPVAVTAAHTGLAGIEAGAVRQRWLTAAGIALLFLVMVTGLALARRALLHEARARALRDDFLANVSHELKTPLTSLCLHAEMLAGDGLGGDERARYGRVALAEGARLSALVEELLDFSALARGVRRIEPEPVDLARAARELADAWQPLAARDGVALRCEVAGETAALCDATALSRVLMNLLQNALRHGRPPRNGGPPGIAILAGPGPCVEVRDNGPGIPPELRARVFERFERAGAKGAGLGLGLALSSELARACGGRLLLIDDGHETVFRLELPAVQEGEA
jgi:signal transduction histidine kinase